jgi:hypothetical protein
VFFYVEIIELSKNLCDVESNGRHEFQLLGGISAHAYRRTKANGLT